MKDSPVNGTSSNIAGLKSGLWVACSCLPGEHQAFLSRLASPSDVAVFGRVRGVSPARGPPVEWGELVQVHNDRAIFQ